MASEFCPQCGQQRVASFRFCRSCRFDFDGLPPSTKQTEGPEAPTQAPAERDAAVPPVRLTQPVEGVADSPGAGDKRNWRRWGLVGGGLVLAAAIIGSLNMNPEPTQPTGAASTPSSTRTPTPRITVRPVEAPDPTATPVPTPCLDEDEAQELTEAVTDSLQEVIDALSEYDVVAAAHASRRTVARIRQLADTVSEVDPRLGARIARSAEAMDDAATALESYDLDGAIGYMDQSLEEVGDELWIEFAAYLC